MDQFLLALNQAKDISEEAFSTNKTLEKLEAPIAEGRSSFEPVGTALKAIRDGEWYKSKGYSSFLEYCKREWDMHRRLADYLIRAADVMTTLRSENFCSLPTCEAQVRPLTKIPEAARAEIWQQVLESVPTGKITAAIVNQVVKEYQQQGIAVASTVKLTKRQLQIANALTTLSRSNIGQVRELIFSAEGAFLSLPEYAQKVAEMLSLVELTLNVTADDRRLN